MWKPYISFLLLFSTLLFLSPTTAEIKSLTINSDTRPMIFFEKFGFAFKGHVTISVNSVSVVVLSSSSQLDSSRLGFFLLKDEFLPQILTEIQQKPSFCALDYHYIYPLFTFHDLSHAPSSATFNHSYPIFSPNEYSLFFANCAPETCVSMVVRTEIFNLDTSNGSKDYLSVGQTQLPSLYSFFFLAYLIFFVIWIYTCYTNKRSMHRFHVLMAILLFMKSLNLICAAEDKHYVKVTGQRWNLWAYTFQFIRIVLLFTVIVLIGVGWSFLKPSLQDREKKVLMIVIPLQVLANLASVVISDTDPFIKDWVTWNHVFLLIDIICFCAIIFPIIWSIKSLRELSKTDGKASRNLDKLILFRQFYIVVIGYLCFTRIVVFILRTIVAYKYQWVSNAAEETTSFAFFVVMFYMFIPVGKNECFVLDEKEVDEIALRNDSFCLRNFATHSFDQVVR